MRTLCLVLYTLTLSVSAQTVYRTVENGVVTFSDTPPEAGEVEMINLPELPPADSELLDTRLAAMRETTDRMAADRREREKHRAELRALQASAPEFETQRSVVVGSYWPVTGNGWRPARPPFHRPPYRPKPTPLPHPPPGWSVMKPGNAQLMRPIVSSRR